METQINCADCSLIENCKLRTPLMALYASDGATSDLASFVTTALQLPKFSSPVFKVRTLHEPSGSTCFVQCALSSTESHQHPTIPLLPTAARIENQGMPSGCLSCPHISDCQSASLLPSLPNNMPSNQLEPVYNHLTAAASANPSSYDPNSFASTLLNRPTKYNYPFLMIYCKKGKATAQLQAGSPPGIQITV